MRRFRCPPFPTAIRCCSPTGSVPGQSNTNQETITTRFDHSFTDRDKFYARYTQGNQTRNAYSSGTIPLLDGVANYTVRPETNHSLALNWVKTVVADAGQ